MNYYANFETASKVEYIIPLEHRDNIVIYNNQVYGLKSGTTTKVKAKLDDSECEFEVSVVGGNVSGDLITGSNFNEISIDEVSGLADGKRKDFIMGVDISSINEVLSNGGKFYNGLGQQESVYLLLKNAGVNYVRIRLWNDPKGTVKDYGGGNNNLDVAIKIAAISKALEMKVLLDFHYSDFWADPGKQVIPKDWSAYTTSNQVANAISSYTKECLNRLKENNALPDMVQIGNEITGGLILQGTSNYDNMEATTDYFPLSSAIRGNFGSDNHYKYLKAGLDAVYEVDENIETMIHIDKGANNASCINYYNFVGSLDFDYIGLSYYPFYHGDITAFSNNITDLESRFGKRIIVAETSYAFTEEAHPNNSSIFKNATKNKGWSITPAGQADMVRDIVDKLANLPNARGAGLFYWEPAWLPVQGAGWASKGTSATWADQALFSYDGVKLPSLDVFNKVRGND